MPVTDPSWIHLDRALGALGYECEGRWEKLEDVPEPHRSVLDATPPPADVTDPAAFKDLPPEPWREKLEALIEMILHANFEQRIHAIPLRIRELRPEFAVYVLTDEEALEDAIEEI